MRSKGTGCLGSIGTTVPWTEVGISHNHFYFPDRYIQFISHLHSQRCDGALAHFNLPCKTIYHAIFRDLQESIEIGRKRPALTGLLCQKIKGIPWLDKDEYSTTEKLKKFSSVHPF